MAAIYVPSALADLTGVLTVSAGGTGLGSAVSGLLKGDGTSYAAAVAGTDYVSPGGSYSDPAWITALAASKLTGSIVATNGVVTTGSYADPAWITSLGGSKLTGTVVATNGVVTTGSYADPGWITSLAGSKLAGTVIATNGIVSTGSYSDPSWLTALASAKVVGTIGNQSGTTYTLQASDNGTVVRLNNASAITVTLPNSLPAGFNCLCIQSGAGQVTFSAASGAVLNQRQGNSRTAGQHAVVSLIVTTNVGGAAAAYNLSGDTA